MKVGIKNLEKSEVELTIEVPYSEVESFLDHAAQEISKDLKFNGFRPGKAPRALVEKRVGAQAILEEAVNIGMPKFYTDAVLQEKVEVVGQPQISISKLAPHNNLEFTARVGVMPQFDLPHYRNVKVKRIKIKDNSGELDKTIDYLRKSRATYKTVTRPAQKGDRVFLDFDMFLNNVPLEDGSYKDHPVIIGENQIVQGFEDQLIGLLTEKTKKFNLLYPKEHFKKEIAGKRVDFKVKVKKIEEVGLPELNDDFAKALGDFKSMDDLKTRMKKNIKLEAETKEKQRIESETLEIIAKKTTMEIPEVLIQSETEKMIAELKNNIKSSGGDFQEYLQSLKKSEKDLKNDLRPQAEKRAKIGLIVREIAKKEDIIADKKEIKEEINKILLHESGNPEIKKKITSLEFKEYISHVIRNRKVLAFLVGDTNDSKDKDENTNNSIPEKDTLKST